MQNEIYFKVDVYYINNAFRQHPKEFANAVDADEFARKKADENTVKCCKLFQYIQGEKKLLSTIFKNKNLKK